MELEKIAEDELMKLQRQFRIVEIDRAAVSNSYQPTLRVQRNIIKILHEELEKIMLELKLTKSQSNIMENERVKEKLILLLREHDKYSSEVREQKKNIEEMDFLLRQVEKEIKILQSKGSKPEEDCSKSTNHMMMTQLENRLNTAMKKFNTINSENAKMRTEIDRLLRDRQSFNTVWRNQVKRLMEGKSHILELVEQAITTYDQREEWCSKLEALKEKAGIDYRKHCLEVRELQRQLDHSLKLEQFLRIKGTIRLTAADAKAEAKRVEQQEEELQTYNNYVNILETIKEYAGENDVDKLIQEFKRREEENFALFNYVNEVNSELKHLHDNVKMLKLNIADEREKHQASLEKQQDNIDALKEDLEQRKHLTSNTQTELEKSNNVLNNLLQEIHCLAKKSNCESVPLVKLLGKSLDINISNARLYIKCLEKKIREVVDIIRIDELLQKQQDAKERTPPSTRRRHPPHTPRVRKSPRAVSPARHQKMLAA